MLGIDTARTITKPPCGTGIDWANPVTTGLLFHALLNEGNGGTVYDLVRGLALPLQGGAVWSSSIGGLAVKANANNAGARVTLPSYLQLGPPLTVACDLVLLGSPTSGVGFFGATPDATAASPFTSYVLDVDTTFFRFDYNNNGTFTTLNTGVAYAGFVGKRVHIAATLTPSLASIYINGVLINSVGLTLATIAYTGTAQLLFATVSAVRNPACSYLSAAVWNRALSSGELLALAAYPYGMVEGTLPYFMPHIAAAPPVRRPGMVLGL